MPPRFGGPPSRCYPPGTDRPSGRVTRIDYAPAEPLVRFADDPSLRHARCRTARHMSNNRLTNQAEVSADCKHPEVEYLGENRGLKFLRCEVCSRVYVLQEG